MRKFLGLVVAAFLPFMGFLAFSGNPANAANAPLLPGTPVWTSAAHGSVSSYLFGSNDTINYGSQVFDNTPAVQSQVKAAGLTLDRMWAYNGNDTDAQILARVQAAENSGMTCLFMLGSTDSLSWMEHVVGETDNYCHFYEFGNEPDAGNNPNNSNMTTYTNWWITDIPQLRAMFPGTYYGGPTLTWSGGGSVSGYPDSMAYFLSATAAAGVRADFITYHDYPCQAGKQDTEAACLTATQGDFAWNYNNVTQYETQYYGGIIPTGVTEYNFDAGDQHFYDWNSDGTFMSQWETTALDAIAATGMSFANQFDLDNFGGYGGYDLFSGTTAKPAFNAMAQEVINYGGNGVVTQPTAPSTPAAPTATAGNAQATVNWTAPYNGGDPITGYTLTASTGQVVNTTATNATVTGLTNGTPVTFTVTATNNIGQSALSAPSNAVTPSSVITTPTFVQAAKTHKSAVSSAAVTFINPVTAGDSIVVETGVWAASSPTAKTVTDSAGDVFTEVTHVIASDQTELAVWTATASTTGTLKVTVTPTAKADVGVAALEYANLGAPDGIATASGTTTAATTVSSGVTPVSTGAGIAIGFYNDSGFGDSLGKGAAWTTRVSVPKTTNMEFLVEDEPIAAGGSTSATFKTGANTTWQAVTILFQ